MRLGTGFGEATLTLSHFTAGGIPALLLLLHFGFHLRHAFLHVLLSTLGVRAEVTVAGGGDERGRLGGGFGDFGGFAEEPREREGASSNGGCCSEGWIGGV